MIIIHVPGSPGWVNYFKASSKMSDLIAADIKSVQIIADVCKQMPVISPQWQTTAILRAWSFKPFGLFPRVVWNSMVA